MTHVILKEECAHHVTLECVDPHNKILLTFLPLPPHL